ncbi:hypothetical protein ACFXJJ_27495, partial [Streptomyces sp. NPDC059233]
AGLAAGIPAVMLHPSAEGGGPAHGATLFPIEDGRWIVTLTGTREATPPTDERGFADCVRALRSPVVAELLAAAEPLGGVRPFRATANRRRFYERRPRTEGFLVVGDALTAVNPVHSHGMSIALLSALRLDRAWAEHGAKPSGLPALQAAVAEVADTSWRMATEQDRMRAAAAAGPAAASAPADPTAPAASAAGRQMRARMARALLTSPALMSRLFRAQTLVPAQGAEEPTSHPQRPTHPNPPLDTDEAVAQFPVLSEWWFSERPSRQATWEETRDD